MATSSAGIVSGWRSILSSRKAPSAPSAPSIPSGGGGGGGSSSTNTSAISGTTATRTDDGRTIYTDASGKIVATQYDDGRVFTSTGQAATIEGGALKTPGGSTFFTESGSVTQSTTKSGDIVEVVREDGTKSSTLWSTSGRSYDYLSPAAEAAAMKTDNMTPADANMSLVGGGVGIGATPNASWWNRPTGPVSVGDSFVFAREPGASLGAAILSATGQPLRVTSLGATSVQDAQGAMFSTKNINPFLPGVNIGRLNTLEPGLTTTEAFRLERVRASKAGIGGVVPIPSSPIIETSIVSRTQPVTLTGKAFELLPEGDKRLLRYAGKGAGAVLDATSATLNYSTQNLAWVYDQTVGRASGALGRALDYRGGLTLSAQDFTREAQRWAIHGDESFTRGAEDILRGRVVGGVNELTEGLFDYWSSTSFRAAAAWQRGLATDPIGLTSRSLLAAATVQSPGLAADYLMFNAVDKGIAATWSDKDTRFARQFVGGVILAENPANIFGGRSFARTAPELVGKGAFAQFLGAGNAIAKSGGVYEGLAQVYVYEQVNELPFDARRYAQGAAFGYASSFVLGGLYGRSKLPGVSSAAQSIGEKSELAAWIFDRPEAPGDIYTGLRGPSRFNVLVPVGSVTQNLDIAALGFSGETVRAASTRSTVMRGRGVSPATGMNVQMSVAPVERGVSSVTFSASPFLSSARTPVFSQSRAPAQSPVGIMVFAPAPVPAQVPVGSPLPSSTRQNVLVNIPTSAFAPVGVTTDTSALLPALVPVQAPSQVPAPTTVPTAFGFLPGKFDASPRKREKAPSRKRETRYAPSVKAAALDIKAPRGFTPPKAFAGLEFRPLYTPKRRGPVGRRRRKR